MQPQGSGLVSCAVDAEYLCIILQTGMGRAVWGPLRAVRRRLLAIIAAGFGLSSLLPPAANAITAQPVASGLTQPVFVTAAPNDSAHIYIVLQTGRIMKLNLNTGQMTTFFTLTGLAASGEQGLLGMAFDPDYATNGKFYLNFTVPGGAFGNGVTRVSQFQTPLGLNVSQAEQVTSGDGNGPRTDRRKKRRRRRFPKPTPTPVRTPTPTPAPTATPGGTPNPASERVLLRFDHPQANHNGGWIAFSPRIGDRNNLYIATGDGGGGNDQGTGHIEPGGNAQSNITLLGKILRIQVDSNLGVYSIPPGNPFASSGTFRREIWAYGLRNPYRASFDRQTGRLFIGDVGQSTREEIDVQQPANPGGGENYGWRLREGTIANPASVGGPPPPGNVQPIFDYGRATGGTVIGGYVYRGNAIPALQGKYIFGDYVSGKIFSLDYNGTTASNFQDITSQLFPTRAGGFTLRNPSSFGEDANGELYICDIAAGSVFKIVP
ncbi:MAG TPA: PQQ-dependent sugar dehydrogenase [Chthoniobacterales bacterium]|nr:PQQ-dependent sugar dehydrogenase [Chthoniobacterales bacterium]